jgi:hypothetical protein
MLPDGNFCLKICEYALNQASSCPLLGNEASMGRSLSSSDNDAGTKASGKTGRDQ